MKNSLSFTGLASTITRLLHRFHVILFALVSIGSLAAATLFLNELISRPTTNSDNTAAGKFDDATIKRILLYRTAEEQVSQASIPLNKGKRNPIVETP
ncbi:exported protein of unknown function [Candidatus Saccharimonas aalborgensis]|jgi:hypothetical protein|uniref:Uncharacterized protein n=1 Tax=Candidatus Saccharimonas aalborgensis TaxID=1332188 RepID=R4PWB0_9BACT|nr:hypothetical protein [Candidatus Saccharimonas aalborgensis]AGL62037.1 exported protein of unknown function [Candidatus Saccharimonas aalborgensis]QQR50812.1 MAG: hypothetical protein IPF89_03440 [Candidatus Saccharibacteria bacterium]QQS68561.1 MAG: hypothetical protein IPP24_00810 [Candidatus Saccharibacteria bacterium]QQS70858.1 MAG: hypothetical protein IPP92_00975 [Candidatus Saccharibacteria bacterium]